jgi:biuret amidohydrolase
MRHIGQLSIPQDLQDICTAQRMALLIYDMQEGITRQLSDAPAIIDRVKRALEAARVAGMRVVYTRHMSLPITWMGSFQFRMAMAWQQVSDPEAVQPWFLRDTPGFRIIEALAPRPTEAVFDKLAMSAFEGTPLAFALRDCGIVAIAIAGIALEIGIEPTVRHAADLGIIPVLIADACGSGDAAAGRRSLESLRFAGDAIITTTEEFCQAVAPGEQRVANP